MRVLLLLSSLLLLLQLRKQCVELKRRSQELGLEQWQAVDINIDDVDSASDTGTDEDKIDALNKKILCNYCMYNASSELSNCSIC